MIIPYSKIVGAKVFETKGQSMLGEIADVVLSGVDLLVLALILKDSSLFKKHPRAIATTDIISVNNYAVMVGNKESISNVNELVRVQKAIERGFSGVDQLVITKNGKKIGRVFDYLVDTASLAITKIYVKNVFQERIIPVSAVTDIQNHKIIIKDDYELVQVKTALAAEGA